MIKNVPFDHTTPFLHSVPFIEETMEILLFGFSFCFLKISCKGINSSYILDTLSTLFSFQLELCGGKILETWENNYFLSFSKEA
jgi:hypothetical protein